MASQTDLLNDALGLAGVSPRISAIDDGTTNANHCATFYPSLRDGLMRAHHWNFIITRVQLALDVAVPVSGFAYGYTLPSDCLKVMEYAGGGTFSWANLTYPTMTGVRNVMQYKIEGRKLLSNDVQAFIVYLRRETNPDLWDAMFYQSVVAFLAAKLAMAIPKDATRALRLSQQAEQLLLAAMAIDGQEGSSEPFVVDDLIWGR